MSELANVYGINFLFDSSDNVTKTINQIVRSFRNLEDEVKNSKSFNDAFGRMKSGLEEYASKLQEVQRVSDDFFKAPSSETFAVAFSKAQEALDSLKTPLEALRKIEDEVAKSGGDTSAILDSIKTLNAEITSLNDAAGALADKHFAKLVDEFTNAKTVQEQSRVYTEAVSDAMKVLGLSADEARNYWGQMLEKIKESKSVFEEVGEQIESPKKKGIDLTKIFESLGKQMDTSQSIGKSFGGVFRKIGESIGGSKGLTAILKGARGGLIGLGAAIGSQAIKIGLQELNKLLNKGKQAIVEWVKSWGELKRALREGVGSATVGAQDELRRLDELNAKLSSATRYSAEYNNAKKEILSTYGKYNQYLDNEITKVGNLSTVYDQLRGAIIEASLAKERDRLIDETSNKYSEKLTDASASMLKKYQRQFGKERGYEAYKSWRDSMLLGTEMSEDAQWGANKSGSRKFARNTRRMNNRISQINAVMSPTTTDLSFDYSEVQRQVAESQRYTDIIRSAKQAEVDIIRDQDQMIINAMADGASKQRAQAKLDYQRRLDQMKEWKEQYVRQQMEMWKADFINAGHDESEWNPYALENQIRQRRVESQADEILSKKAQLELQMLNRQLADIAFQQRQSLISSYGTLAQQKQGAQARWNREEITAEFRDRANAIHEYEFAQMDYESIQKYGSQEQIREALERMLDAEIKTLEDFEKPAAEARKKVTLAEFDADLAQKYAGRADQRKALEDKLNAELQTIDEKYREIQAATNKVTLAEFDQETANQYGTRGQRRDALENVLAARLEEFVKKNGEAQKAIIEAQNEYELASFDYEEIVDYGSYDQVLEKLRTKWQKFIATLPDDLKRGATKQMNAEIYELQRQHEGVYQQIFADMDNMTREGIDRTIALAQEELQHLAETGNVSADVIGELADRLDALRTKRDQLDFGGWGGSISGILGLNAERTRNRSRRENLVNARNEMLAQDPAARLSEDYMKLSRQIHEADEAEEQLTQDIKKQAAVIAASGIADAFSQIGGLLNDIAQVSGNTGLAKFGQEMAEFGSSLSNVANGFAQGGIVGGIVAAAKETVNAVIEVVRSVATGAAQWEKTIDSFSKSIDKMKYALDSSQFESIFGVNAAGYASDAYSKAALALRDYKAASDELKNVMFKTQEDPKNPWWLKASPLTAMWSWYQTLFGKNKHQESFGKLDIWGEDGMLDVDKAQAFLAVQTTLTAEQVEQIENAIKLKQAYDEATAAVEDYVASFVGSTVSDLAGEMLENFLETGDAVMDLTDNMDSFAQAIAKSAIEARLLNEVFTEDMQQKMVDLIVSGNNTGAIDLYNQLLNQANSLAPSINEFLSGIGIKPREEEEEDRRAARRSSLGASQDSFDESNARLTAIQAHTYSINEAVLAIRMQNEELRLRSTEILTEIMGIHQDTTNAGLMMEEMMGYIKDVRLGVNTIVDKGVTVL